MAVDICVVGNKVDIPDISLISKHDNDNIIMFVGKMNYEPNVVAVTYFAEKIFPKLCVYYPNLNFLIVGAHPDSRVQKLGRLSNIVVTGYVESIEPYYRRATIVVAPMQTGAGIQNKIIQAMSYACCVVTTPIGAEGLMIKNNEIAIFQNAEEWIDGIKLLLNSREKREYMGLLARSYVIKNLSKDVIARQFWHFMSL